MDEEQIQRIIEAALLAADGPLTVANLTKLFAQGELDEENASRQVRDALKSLQEQSEGRGVELKRVASGYRYQVRQELSDWVSRLWDEKPPRYTRALLETLALVAYKQPVTRGDIEQVRGVSVSQNIMRTLVERDWIRVVGQREVPGRPSLYGTTKTFLDYFNLQSLSELPPLAEIRALIEPALVETDETITVAVQSGDVSEPTESSDQASADVVQLHSGAGPGS
ncbi:MAG: SMC-Scp complex subunit ScpB [bacterium]